MAEVPGDAVLLLQLPHLRLRLLQPVRHAHVAVHRRRGGEVLAGLVAPVRAVIERAQAEVAGEALQTSLNASARRCWSHCISRARNKSRALCRHSRASSISPLAFRKRAQAT